MTSGWPSLNMQIIPVAHHCPITQYGCGCVRACVRECVCVCVCDKERKREGYIERESEREREREEESAQGLSLQTGVLQH